MDEVRKQIGERLGEARKAAGLSQQRAADLLGIDRPRLSGMEQGERPVEVLLLTRIAQLYGVSTGFFLGGDSGTRTTPAMRLRSNLAERLDGKEVGAILNGFLKFVERYQKLSEKLEQRNAITDLPDWKGQGNSYTRGFGVEADAERLRDFWGLDDAPVGLGIFELLESHGIRVYREALDDLRISGAYLEVEGLGSLIFVNAADMPYRQVFTAAHELAHLLYHRGGGVSFKDDDSSEESLANEFASAFLMPDSAIKRHLATREARKEAIAEADVIDLQRTFGVSYAAMLVRLRRLRILNADSFESLKQVQPVKKALELGYPVRTWEFAYDPMELPASERIRWVPRSYRALVREALEGGELTERMAARYVNLEYEDWAALQQHPEPDLNQVQREFEEAEQYVR